MLENGGADAGRAVPVERPPPGQHLEDDRAEREQIAPRIDLVTFDLFGRHVADRAQDGAVRASRRASSPSSCSSAAAVARVRGGPPRGAIRLL